MQIVLPILVFDIIAAILLGLAYWLGRSGLRGVRNARASLAWSSTPGKVLLVNVIKVKDAGSSTGQRRRTNYRPVVQCSYNVIVYPTIEKAWAAVKGYQVGQTVQVYYDPAWRELSSGILCFLLALLPISAMLALVRNIFQ